MLKKLDRARFTRITALLLMAGASSMVAGAVDVRAADVTSPWRETSDTLIRSVARNADLPDALVPVAIAEDSTGFLWLGGGNGLIRWDGYQFRDHKSDPTLLNSVRDLDIASLHRDSSGRLWAGLLTGGVARYDPSQDRLICVPLAAGKCGSQHVWAMDEDGEGGLWVATNQGLFRLGKSGTLEGQWHHLAGGADVAPDDEVLAVLRDHVGAIWLGTTRGLFRLNEHKSAAYAVVLSKGTQGAVSRLMEDSVGRLWVGTRQQGAYLLSTDRRQTNPVPGTTASEAVDVATEVSALLEVSPGRVWIGTYGAGIVDVDVASEQVRRIVHDPLVPDGLGGDSIQSLYRDRSGLVWIGANDGLSQYNPASSGIITLFGNTGRLRNLPGENVMSVLGEPDGSLWAGLQGQGFVVLDPSGRRASGLPGYRVFSLLHAPAPLTGVLLGTDGGLFLSDPSGKRVRRLAAPSLDPKMAVLVIRNVNGHVWLAAREGGLWELSFDAVGNVRVLRHETAASLTDAVLDTIDLIPGGKLAIGTDIGANLLDLKTGEMERITADPADPEGLDPGVVTSFATDRLGRLWIGTVKGVNILIGRDALGRRRFRHLRIADGLPNDAIDSLIADNRGHIWASTDRGLAEIDPETLKVTAARRADGLAITNYFEDSATMLATGELAFSGVGGVTIVRSGVLKEWRYRPPVVATSATVGGRLVRLGPTDVPLVISPGEDSFSVEFAALDFSAPLLNQYSHRLEGFDPQWTPTEATNRSASYTNLPPRDYFLRLRGSNRNGVWTEPDTIIRLRVLPAWYQTTWFSVCLVAVAALLVLALMRGSTAILRRRQRELQRQVAERTAELSASQSDLLASNAGLEKRVAERTSALAERTHALESSEARFRAWFNNAEDAVFVVQVGRNKQILYEAANAAAERLFGVAPTAYPGCDLASVLPPSIAGDILAHFADAAKGEPIQFETHLQHEGTERLLDSWIVPVRDPLSGRVERLVGASRDVTERRALEARLTQSQKLQALGGLAGGIAHDFNNILQAVAGAALLIQQSLGDHERIRRLASSTLAAAERGASITKRLLAFARHDELRVEAIPTAEVLEGLSDVLTYTLGREIEVHTALASTLPAILADRGQLETALVNLGTNARDAMPNGGLLTLAAAPVEVADGEALGAGIKPGLYVKIDVTDTGEGMDRATLDRAIEPFFTTKPQGQGTGLGLALVKGFTEQSGGGMSIESAPGRGTTVSLWLRQAGSAATNLNSEVVTVRKRSEIGEHILVIDDDELVRETIVQLLDGAGFSVTAAASGADAITQIQYGTVPDAIVCDLSMPGMNGIETIRRARELIPGLVCFLLTGYAGERAALGTGDSFTLLSKPISATDLIAQIEAGLVACQSRGEEHGGLSN